MQNEGAVLSTTSITPPTPFHEMMQHHLMVLCDQGTLPATMSVEDISRMGEEVPGGFCLCNEDLGLSMVINTKGQLMGKGMAGTRAWHCTEGSLHHHWGPADIWWDHEEPHLRYYTHGVQDGLTTARVKSRVYLDLITLADADLLPGEFRTGEELAIMILTDRLGPDAFCATDIKMLLTSLYRRAERG